jgi:hypothetical protein
LKAHIPAENTLLRKGDLVLTIPNPHKGTIGVDLLTRILKQARISREEWLGEEGSLKIWFIKYPFFHARIYIFQPHVLNYARFFLFLPHPIAPVLHEG